MYLLLNENKSNNVEESETTKIYYLKIILKKIYL